MNATTPSEPAGSGRALLTGQSAIVTGASSGIGASVARAMAAAGAAVVVNYSSSPEDAERIAQAITRDGGRAIPMKADVSREEDVTTLFAQTIEHFGTIDIVVSNAGIQKDAALVDMTLEQWQEVIDVNLTGSFLCAREAARIFLRQGPRPDVSRATGKIIFTSSVHEIIPWAGHVNYAASKGGALLFMKSIAQELGPRRIRVNSIAPGAIRTSINTEAWSTPEAEAALLKLIPYGRIGEPEDIGRAAVWLASDEADYVHGASIVIDGGMTLYPGFAAGG